MIGAGQKADFLGLSKRSPERLMARLPPCKTSLALGFRRSFQRSTSSRNRSHFSQAKVLSNDLRTSSESPFGDVVLAAGSAAAVNPFRFSTKYQDDESGLFYYGYRYYIPGTGRWASSDPMQEAGGLNLYGFLGNEAVNSSDYLGLWSADSIISSLTSEGNFSLTVPIAIVGPGWVKLKAEITAGKITCCNTKGQVEKWLAVEVWGDVFWETGTSVGTGKTKKPPRGPGGHSRNVPHPCKKGAFVRADEYAAALKACKKTDPDGNINVYGSKTGCPDKEGLAWLNARIFVEGSAGIVLGAYVRVEVEADILNPDINLNVEGGATFEIGASFQAGGGLGMKYNKLLEQTGRPCCKR